MFTWNGEIFRTDPDYIAQRIDTYRAKRTKKVKPVSFSASKFLSERFGNAALHRTFRPHVLTFFLRASFHRICFSILV